MYRRLVEFFIRLLVHFPDYRSRGQNVHEALPLVFLGRKRLRTYVIPREVAHLNPQMNAVLQYPA
jgi:hypothetical protein